MPVIGQAAQPKHAIIIVIIGCCHSMPTIPTGPPATQRPLTPRAGCRCAAESALPLRAARRFLSFLANARGR
eukprot:745922-Hanusia_phi.AAC.2